MLYPQSNKCRSLCSLNGLWKFKTVSDTYTPEKPLSGGQLMPVPASFNDIVVEKPLRDYIGKVAYEREFSLPIQPNVCYRLRLGATSHKCEVYLNGEKVGDGINGYYPIDLPLENLQPSNRLTVVIDNRLDFWTFPPGLLEKGRQTINFDFFNYTGIHRDVFVYGVPEKYIQDIVVHTVVDGDYHRVKVDVLSNCEQVKCRIIDASDKEVWQGDTADIYLQAPILWKVGQPYLYKLIVETETDYYEETFGIRKVSYDEKGLYLNDEFVYLKGFNMHEDFFIFGKGNNSALNIRNFELLKWTGANSIRTSHYPYSEEIMRLADEYGIMVIDELPAVGMNAFRGEGNFTPNRMNEKTKALHKELVKQLLERDKNHPCVVMISVANEPATEEIASRAYFKDVIEYTRSLTQLPIMIAEVTKLSQGSQVADLVDFTALNRYYGWYEEHGWLDYGLEALKEEVYGWYEKYKKPILMSEFGTDTLEGLHSLPSETFSEEYQTEFLQTYCNAFDEMPFVIGEHVWNFADFKTKQGVIRVRGNRKGVFSRDRQPKLAAYWLKERWENK